MTREEKVLLLSGENTWRTNAIPRLGISRIKTSDGPTGVRGGKFIEGVTAASPPSGVSLAATWDHQVIKDVAKILITEARSKEVDVLLGPTICIPRHPLGGRNFEAYSEDPYLTGKLAATYINSIQEAGIGTCVKHFAANDQEDRRFFIDEQIPDRALREIHFQPFQIALREANPWCVMTAYNKINGTYCSNDEFLLQEVLRGEWGWDGLVMSDWFGTNGVVPSVKAGMDLEMPGPTRRRGKHLLAAHEKGLIETSAIDACVLRFLELLYKTGKSEIPDWKENPEQAHDDPEHRKTLRKAAAEGIVLLKNSAKLLPLENLEGKTIAIVGPNAARSVATGGGSSNLVPHYRTTPYDSLKAELAEKFPSSTVKTARGIPLDRYLPLLDPAVMRNPVTGESGFVVSCWRNMTHSGDPFLIENRKSSNLVLYDSLPTELTMGERYSYRARSIVTPKTTGVHQFSLSSCGPGKMFLDGKLIINIERRWWSPKSPLFMSYGSPEQRVEVHMEAGKSYELLLESVSREPKPIEITYNGEIERDETQDGGRIGFLENEGDLQLVLGEAVELARSSDVAIVVVGRDADWETETSDIVSLHLPRESDALVAAVARANPNTIVVNQSGGPIAMPWEESVSTIIQAWYQGQEQGNALADILLGTTSPCGKLPVTFPRRIEDTPAFDNYPGENDKTYYGEGIYVGYRFYDHRKIEPLFPFGAGMSYTAFEYSNIRLSGEKLSCDGSGSNTIEVEVDVTNTGSREGKEIVQFYVTQVTKPRLGRPSQELKGWDKVLVRPRETVTARATLDRVAISYWDDSIDKWVVDADSQFKVRAAKSSRDEGISAVFSSASRFEWVN
ncbi:hypothetical protein GQ53DRAFT_868132 [Thozetella sp. PMI_491]|nr:hypothetical protein GQ53DRAFT_868132 [Thozetella sp. PMI_491]